jgi:hypothetical protein
VEETRCRKRLSGRGGLRDGLWLRGLSCLLQCFVEETKYIVIMLVKVFQDRGETIGKGTVFLGPFRFI